MSDIPPDLIDPPNPVPKLKAFAKRERSFLRENWLLIVVLLGCLLLWPYVSRAAALDLSEVYCELFEPCQDGRYCIAADPLYTADCPHPWVTLRVAKFRDLQAAYESSGGASAPSSGDFTPDEVAKLKTQAQVGLTMQIEPKPADPEHISDMGIAFGLAFLALIGIWGARQLRNVFMEGPGG